MANCTDLAVSLSTQLESNFRVEAAEAGCVIVTPFLYPDRRIVTIFAETLPTGEILLSDDGYGHYYARMCGVSSQLLKTQAETVARRYEVESGSGEVIAHVSPSDLLSGVTTIVDASKEIASSTFKKRLGDPSNRLDRRVARVLLDHRRTYERRKPILIDGHSIDVDFLVLPTEEYQQLSLFSLTPKISKRTAESMAYRIDKIVQGKADAGYTNRVFVVSDESARFENQKTYSTALNTVRETGVEVIRIDDFHQMQRILAS